MILGRMYNAGQVCCGSKRFLIHRSLIKEFTKKAIDRINALNFGLPTK